MDQLRNALRLLPFALAAILGVCPAALGQDDRDLQLKQALDDWKDGSPVARARAIQTLESLGANAAPALPVLVAALADPDAAIRAEAASVLGNMAPAGSGSLPALTTLLDDREASVRVGAAIARGDLRTQVEGGDRGPGAEPPRRSGQAVPGGVCDTGLHRQAGGAHGDPLVEVG